MSRTDQISIDELRAAVDGAVIAPGDPGYDDARMPFYGGFDRRPAAIVRAAHVGDVSAVVALARRTGIELAVRGGGHSNAGHSTTEAGILLDLAGLDAFDVDLEARTAWAGAGLTAVGYSVAAAEHGLVTGFGDAGSVGLAGITLGGGVGFLVRRFGLTIDDLLAVELVTADGEVRTVDAGSDPDLFWALRGGGGNFGVVTKLRLRLHDLPTVVGGMLILPATPATIAGFATAAGAAPYELSTIANVMVAPPMPFLPEAVHGQLVILAMLMFAGGPEAAGPVLAPFRALATALADLLHEMPYHEIYPPEEDGFTPMGVARTMFVDHVDEAVGETILAHLGTSTAMMAAAQIRVLGGAMARVPNDATAFGFRDRRIMVNLAALYADPAERPEHETWVETFRAAMDQGDDGAYVNFLMDEGPERVRAAYPGATWDRLRAIKRRYDPENVFRLNQNIPPADADA